MEAYEEKELRLSDSRHPFSAFVNNSSQNVNPHWHNHIELLYLTRGRADVTIGSEVFIASQGDFLIIHSNEIHSVKMYSCEFLVIQFKPAMLVSSNNELYENHYFISFIQNRSFYSKYISSSGSDTNTLSLLADDILEEFSEKLQGYELNIKGNIYKIFAWLTRNNYILVPQESELASSDMSKLSRVFNHVRDHYGENITIKTAAGMAYMSYHHFCRTFKRVTGKTFVEYLHYVRLNEAEKLLSLTDKNMAEIAAEAGFSSCSHFTNLFKKEKGVSPLKYRKAQTCKKQAQPLYIESR